MQFYGDHDSPDRLDGSAGLSLLILSSAPIGQTNLWYKVATGSEPANYAFTFSSIWVDDATGYVMDFGNVNTSSPFDLNSCTSGTSESLKLTQRTHHCECQ